MRDCSRRRGPSGRANDGEEHRLSSPRAKPLPGWHDADIAGTPAERRHRDTLRHSSTTFRWSSPLSDTSRLKPLCQHLEMPRSSASDSRRAGSRTGLDAVARMDGAVRCSARASRGSASTDGEDRRDRWWLVLERQHVRAVTGRASPRGADRLGRLRVMLQN